MSNQELVVGILASLLGSILFNEVWATEGNWWVGGIFTLAYIIFLAMALIRLAKRPGRY